MKKLLCLLLALCMCFSLSMLFTACDDEPADQPPPEEPQEGQVLLNGVPLADYVIVYSEVNSDMEEAAAYLAASIKTDFLIEMKSMSDLQTPAEYEILLGNTNRNTSSLADITLTKNDFLIAPLENKIWITGAEIREVIDSFLSGFVKDGDETAMTLSAPQKGHSSSVLRVMTYNVHGGTNHTTKDLEKINMLLDLIEKYEPDVFGVQEATPNWMSSLRERFGDRYDSVGVGRYADGSGEACAIFYLKSKFECLDSGTRWLSNTPDVPGSKLNYSEYTRIYTYAKLKERETGKVFLHMNTHLDLNDAACDEQAYILMEELKAYSQEDITCLLTGDFNCRKGSGAYGFITETVFADSREVAEDTLNAVDGMIDFIFATKDVDVSYYQLCTEKYERANGEVVQPSDHKPIFIDCVLP